MAHEDQFTAKGPPFSGSGMPFSGFSTTSRNMTYGVNAQGTYTGVYGECVQGESDRAPQNAGIGVCGVGDNFGVFGDVHSRGEHRIAGIYGHHRFAGIGAVGASMSRASGGGIGVWGVSLGSIGNPLGILDRLPGADGLDPDGRGTGVLGCSGSGTGVRGTSDTSIGVLGESRIGPAVAGKCSIGNGVFGMSVDLAGVLGHSETGPGVQGGTGSGSGPGVLGIGGDAPGVRGQNRGGTGVEGTSESGPGVHGSSGTGYGVSGKSESRTGVHGSCATGYGVVGRSGSGTGVQGTCGNGMGVRGESRTGDGVVGKSQSGRGGVFESTGTAEGRVAQIRLVPQSMPVPGEMRIIPVQFDTRSVSSLPADGKGGDLLVTQGEDLSCTLWFCARGSDGGNPAVWRQALLGSPVGAEEIVEVLWPERVVEPLGPTNASQVLHGPNGTMYSLAPGARATFGTFAGRAYPHLRDLLSANRVTHGDAVTAEDLARSDVIAFERNGGSPAAGQGWESCDWSFSDGVAQISVSWNGTAGAARDPHVVANGSIRGADYVRCFGADTAAGYDPVSDNEVISFLLFALPELRTQDPRFTVAVAASTSPDAGEATPDIDAIGVLRLRP